MSKLTFAVVLTAVVTTSLMAQVAGRLSGSVVDPSGGSIPNATVNLYLPGGKTPVLSTKTTQDGNFDFTSVRPESYRLEVRASGFNGYVQEPVAVDPVRQTSMAPIRLELQSATQSVDVIGN